MTKENIIKEYYGEDYHRVINSDYGIDELGYSDFYAFPNETFLGGYEFFSVHEFGEVIRVRPIGLGTALTNLKTNNGWIKVESANDLPKEFIYAFIRTIYPEFPETFVRIGQHMINGKTIIWDFVNDNKYKLKEVTHYKEVKIEKPEPPIY